MTQGKQTEQKIMKIQDAVEALKNAGFVVYVQEDEDSGVEIIDARWSEGDKEVSQQFFDVHSDECSHPQWLCRFESAEDIVKYAKRTVELYSVIEDNLY